MPRFEIELGRLDPRLRLAPCIKIQPYLPPGVRLWGRSRVGLRCVQGAVAWNVYLPVTVKAWSTAVVARRGLPAQTVLNAEDLSLAEVDIAAESSPVVTLLPEATGRTTNRVLQPGEALRQVDLKQRQWFAAGDTVRLTLQGEGFNVMQEGIAITPGIEGQAARIRTDNGKVITAFPSGPKAASVEP
jgi:flagella basal body P-ring formation protein FlgA